MRFGKREIGPPGTAHQGNITQNFDLFCCEVQSDFFRCEVQSANELHTETWVLDRYTSIQQPIFGHDGVCYFRATWMYRIRAVRKSLRWICCCCCQHAKKYKMGTETYSVLGCISKSRLVVQYPVAGSCQVIKDTCTRLLEYLYGHHPSHDS